MPSIARNSKRPLAEADPNAENAPQKRTSARVSAKAQEKENAVIESTEPKGKGNDKTATAAKPKPKPKPKSKGRKKPPMLIAKSGADAYNILKVAKEKEKAEKAETKEREKVEKAERKEKEKVEKAEQKEKEKVEKAEQKEREKVEKAEQKEREKAKKAEDKKKEKAEKPNANVKVTASSTCDAHQAVPAAKKAAAKSKTDKPATGETREKLTSLSAQSTAETENQGPALTGQNSKEGKNIAKGTNERPAAHEQDGSKVSQEPSTAKEGETVSHPNNQEKEKNSVRLHTDFKTDRDR